MRRASVLTIAALAGLLWVSSAWAQPGFVGPGGVINYQTASVSINNSTAAKSLYTYTLPGPLVATQAFSNTTAAALGMQNSSAPLHLRLNGLVSLASGTINCGANYGAGVTGVASVALLNAYGTVTTAGSPLLIDVWLTPIATGNDTTATPNQTNTVSLWGRVELPSATTGYDNVTWSQAFGTLPLASANSINVICNTGTAAAGNSIMIHRAILKAGD